MQREKLCFREISQHRLLTELYLESELEISEEWTETSGVFLSEAAFVAENDLVTGDYCEQMTGLQMEISDDCDKAAFKAPMQNDKIIGAYSLSHRFGVTVLDYIAVKKDARQMGLGSIILRRVKEKCRELGDTKIYLTDKAKVFFLKNGAKEISDSLPLYSKLLGDCAECLQRGRDCFPTVMEITL